MEGADLWEARMAGAVLSGAQMQGAVLRMTDLRATDLRNVLNRGSALKSVDLSEASHVAPHFVMNAFGDASVTLPDGWDTPPHWADEVLHVAAFYGRWRHWREAQGLPWPPPGKALEGLADYEAVAPPGDP